LGFYTNCVHTNTLLFADDWVICLYIREFPDGHI
jgi:hypothetical protein